MLLIITIDDWDVGDGERTSDDKWLQRPRLVRIYSVLLVVNLYVVFAFKSFEVKEVVQGTACWEYFCKDMSFQKLHIRTEVNLNSM